MKKFVIVFVFICLGCYSQNAFAQSSGLNTISGYIIGTYEVQTDNDFYFSDSISSYTRPDGSNAWGETVNYPREKVKFYSEDGTLLSEPQLILPSPPMGAGNDEGYLELPMNGYANPWFFIENMSNVPQYTYNVLLHWKLMGYAYSDEAQTASLNVIAPSHYTELW